MANIFILFVMLVPSSPIAGPSKLKQIAETVIPSTELNPAVTSVYFLDFIYDSLN